MLGGAGGVEVPYRPSGSEAGAAKLGSGLGRAKSVKCASLESGTAAVDEDPIPCPPPRVDSPNRCDSLKGAKRDGRVAGAASGVDSLELVDMVCGAV